MFPNHLLACCVKGHELAAGWLVGIQAEKVLVRNHHYCQRSASLSSEDRSTTAGCKEVMCMWRAYANSPQIRVASWSHYSVSLSSEDRSTTAGCKEVMCMRRAYANSPQIRVASWSPKLLQQYLERGENESYHHTWLESCEGGEVKELGESLELSTEPFRITFVVEQWHIMWSSSRRVVVPVAR